MTMENFVARNFDFQPRGEAVGLCGVAGNRVGEIYLVRGAFTEKIRNKAESCAVRRVLD